MRVINFKIVEGKNFMSIGDIPIIVNLQPGVNTIIGTNYDKEDSKNGVGKTTIINLLTYCLYGCTLNDIPKDYIQNSFTGKRCEMSLVLDVTTNNKTDEFKILRQLNPTKCTLFKNNEDITRSTLAKTNEFIQNLLRTPFSVFQNSVVTSANNTIPFMALSKTDKRKFIESILGLELFSQMLLRAREEHNITKKDYEITFSKLELSKKELEFNNSQLVNRETEARSQIFKLQEKYDNIINDIKSLQRKLKELSSTDKKDFELASNKLKEDKKTQETKLNGLSAEMHQIRADINNSNKQLNNFRSNDKNCPTCKSEYSKKHLMHIEKAIKEHELINTSNEIKEKEIQTSITSIKNVISDIQQKQESLIQTLIKHQQTISEATNIKSTIGLLTKNSKEIQEDISSFKNYNNNELKGKITLLTNDIEGLDSNVSKLNNELNVLESVKFILSEEGIKSFIVKKIIKMLNAKLAYYLKQLDSNCLCQFNEYFEEQIIDEKNNTKTYFNFSGGERKRIDLACLFAFSDIRRMQGDVNFSTVFYDELFDSSLDDRGVTLTLDILKDRFKTHSESCYVITHRGTEMLTKSDHTIHVIKKNNITSIKH